MKERVTCSNSTPSHSVMNNAYKYSELSWPGDYERFKANLTKKFHEEWEEHMTYQWAGDMSSSLKGTQTWSRSAWGTLYTILTGLNEPPWLSKLEFIRNRPLLDIDLKIDENFKPKTGPYTGVGYFMEGIWR